MANLNLRRASHNLLLSILLVTLPFQSFSRPIPSNHTSNHAVIVSSSRFWFNYRHVVNALAIYDLVKKNGIPDDNIVLMLADDIPSNPRNPLKNQMYYDASHTYNLMDNSARIDYRGDDVTVDNLRKVLLGKGHGRVLHTDEHSNVLLYWTGHGGDSFFKFQDVEEVTSADIARLVEDMPFQSLLFLADTCQAFTLGNDITADNVYMIGSSMKGENSYAHHSDQDLGLSVIERYTFQFMEHLRKNRMANLNLQQAMIDPFDYRSQRAHVGFKRTQGTKPPHQVPLSDFFAGPKRKPPRVELLFVEEEEEEDGAGDWSAFKAHSVAS